MNNGNIYAATNAGVFKSTNGGQAWAVAGTGIPASAVWSLGSNSTSVFAGGGGSGLFRSTDDGATWTGINSGLSGPQIRAIGSNGSDLYCGVGGTGVYLSTNNGDNWTAINNGVGSSETVSSFLAYGTAEILTTWDGIYFTTNSGANWTNVSANIVNNSYVGFSSVIAGTDLYVGSGPGMWKRPLSQIVIGVKQISSETPDEFNLYQNYPNPFNPNTKINFDIAKSGFVTLKVFDITGRAVCTLVSSRLTPGTYSADFNASSFSAGVYFYQLAIDNSQLVAKKMVLTK